MFSDRFFSPVFPALAISMGAVMPAEAVLINDKVAAAAGGVANYWDREDRMRGVVSLFAPGSGSSCTGTLINARTVLTAAHCIYNEEAGGLMSLDKLQIRFAPDVSQSSQQDRPLAGAAAYPGWDGNKFLTAGGDIALLTLAAPVTDVPLASVLRQGEPGPAVGDLVTIAGYGIAGNGSGTDKSEDQKRRIAQTLIGFVGKYLQTDLTPVYISEFRNPDSPGSPDRYGLAARGSAMPALQGSAAPGDSGGPLFWQRPDGSQVLVGTVIGTPDENYSLAYGVAGMWTPTKYFTAWLDANNPWRQTTAAAGTQRWSNAQAWRDSLGRADVPDNAVGNLRDGFGQSGRYYQVSLRQASTMTVDMNPSVDQLLVAGPQAALVLPSARTLQVVDRVALQDGRVQLDGRLQTGRFAMNGGVLSGSGTLAAVNGADVQGGLVSPGTADAPGSLAVQGDYRQGPQATLAVRGGDTLAVTGNASLGGTALLLAGSTSYRPATSYRFVSAASISGNFARVGTDLAFLDPIVRSDATSASFMVTRNARSFADAASPDGRGVAAAIDQLGWRSTLYAAVANSSAAQAARAFSSLSGESLASATSVVMDQTRYLREAVSERLRRTGDAPATGASAWLQPYGAWTRLAARADTAALDANDGGVMGGIEHALSADTRVGVAASISRGDINMHQRQASAKRSSYGVLLYGSTRVDDWQLRWGAGVGMHELASQRTPSVAGFSDKLGARYRQLTSQLVGEVAYGLKLGQLELEPLFQLAHVRAGSAWLQESGGEAALAGRIDASQMLVSTTGVRQRSHWLMDDGARWSLSGLLGWQHVLNDPMPGAQLQLRSGGPGFRVVGTPPARDRLRLDVELARQLGTDSSMALGYASQWSRNAQEHVIKAQWRSKF